MPPPFTAALLLRPQNAGNCADFMEWNARSQLTTWHPVAPWHETVGRGTGVGPNDYARKSWAGLVGGYYAARVAEYLAQGLADAAAGRGLNAAAMDRRQAKLAYAWQNDLGDGKYPLEPAGDPVAVSVAMREKYGGYFGSCSV